ncbi:SURF1 family protein [Mesobaculum littorinae]|uniref:SURF1-like protein n=1 Tax=Mesobaculum littorinae TaxID=2486419 RepID=A0A438AIV9_9RHOB|nr:SURF1 family protein [Mesobaculum littorinae]RVV98537.1 SURF1 family protein [Mesobaculum littorinae]
MTRRILLPCLAGVLGVAILLCLGIWQVHRLEWKTAMLADITARISSAPVDLPQDPDPEADRYLPVRVPGQFTGEALHLLVSVKQVGAGYRIVEAFETDTGRRIMVDRGFVPNAEKDADHPAAPGPVGGNLHWPEETDSFTPEPELDRNIWFARDVPRMADALKTEPLLVVARADTGGGVTPLPVGTEGIPNDHLGYAITWFSLAAIWAGMTGFYLWRIRRGSGRGED